jgi:hypothetical protein
MGNYYSIVLATGDKARLILAPWIVQHSIRSILLVVALPHHPRSQGKYNFVYLHWHFDENNAIYSANVKKPYAKEATEVRLHLQFQSSFLQSFNALHLQQN